MKEKKIEYHIRLTEEEDAYLKKNAAAANRTPQQYIKDLMVSKNFRLYRIDIITNDLNEYTALIYRLVKKIESLMVTIKRSGKVYSQDLQKIESLMKEIRDTNREGYKINSKERISLYNKALEFIKSTITE